MFVSRLTDKTMLKTAFQKKKMIPAIVIFTILIINACYDVQCKVIRNSGSDPIVETTIGTIKGLRATDGHYDMFMGIPYALVNQSNIFGSSIPHPPFEDIFEAYDDSVICPQQEEFNYTIAGSLDCLNLNIYVPNADLKENLPVMVFIFGGMFKLGFAGRFLYGPQYLVRHEVILVTVNYRLGPFGFMCLDIPEVSGNAGLKDQVLALRWVQDHIQSFGGDPNQVTLFGNSAGGMACGLHIISEYEKNYNNIILQSGSAFYPGVVSGNENNAPFKISESLGLHSDDIGEALQFLSNQNPLAVVEASLNINFRPCVEKEFPGVERFLARAVINSNHSKLVDMGILIGFNSKEEFLLFPKETGPRHWQTWEGDFEKILENGFYFNEDDLQEAANFVRLFYVGDEEFNNNIKSQMLNYYSDFGFVYSAVRAIDKFLKAGAHKVYQYVFSYDGKRNFAKYRENITEPGAAHADELGYLFKMEFITEEPTAADQLTIDRMTLMWTNFAKFGDPTPDTNDILPVKWNPITSGSPYYYINVNSEMSSGQRYAHDRMTFWDLFYKTYAKYEKGYN